ncbi:MAG: hypothetical protein IJS65_00235 [Clostridia bacterium]|nr:hypothetical protein [Clostridia bacterium]
MKIFKRTVCMLLALCAVLCCAPATFADEEELPRATPTDLSFERPPVTPTDTPASEAPGDEEMPKATPTDITFERPPVTPTDVKPATPTNVPSNGKPPATPTNIPKKPSKPGNKPGDKPADKPDGKPGGPGAPWEHEPASPTDYEPEYPPASPDEIQPEKIDIGAFIARIIKAIVEAIKKLFTSLLGIK